VIRTPFAWLLVLTLLPAAVVVWFANEAMTAQAAAARQQVRDANRGQLRLVRSQVEAHWRAHSARLAGAGTAERRFLDVIEGGADGAIVLGDDGRVVFPDERPSVAAADLEAQLRDARAGWAEDRLAALAGRLNDYTLAIGARDRLRLMRGLRELSPNVHLPTQAALQLSLDVLAGGRPAPPAGFHATTIPDVWAFVGDDRRTIALYRTGRIEAMMHDFLHTVTPARVRFIAYPPAVSGDAEAIAAGAWLPGWQLSYQVLDTPGSRLPGLSRDRLYVLVAGGGVALILLVGVAAGGAVRRHLRLARLKTDLVAAASHELRTPLASMRVLVEGLQEDERLEPPKVRRYLELIAAEHARLTRVIDNFLTFARLDGRQYRFAFAATHPSEIIAAAAETVRDRLPSDRELTVDVPPDLPPMVADAGALCMAVVNLLDNAIKYSPPSTHIIVRARRDGDGHVSFIVEDEGIGIPAGEQRRIFRRFYRVDQRLARDTAGVGLGLSIVDLITRGHGGTVTVRSAPGEGSTFTLRIPATAAGGAA
jgi:two-component system phosphate regulon sensor histidine kinase PhoR